MAQPSFTSKRFNDFRGVDYRSGDVRRPGEFASDALNAFVSSRENLVVRNGFQAYASGVGGGGKAVYVRLQNGSRSEEEIVIDANLWRKKSGTVTIAYAGAATSATFSLVPALNGSAYEFLVTLEEISTGSTVTHTKYLGVGVDESSVEDLGDLKTWIDSKANWSMTISASLPTTVPAAFIPIHRTSSLGPLVIAVSYFEQIFCPTTNPFSSFNSNKNAATFELASMVNASNTLFVATGSNELYVYDGQATYRAGMPMPDAPSSLSAVAGTNLTDATTYYWWLTYEFEDANGNVIEGDASLEASLAVSGANRHVSMTIPNIVAASGFYTNCALANNGGTETGTTLAVDNGSGGAHTLQVGDKVFFRDNGGTLIEGRTVTARTASSITIDGASVTIANNEVISAELRVNLWRNKSGGVDKYLVRTFANNSFSASFSYTDNVADASLGVIYEEPVVGHGVPPANLKYLTVHQGLLIGAKGAAEGDVVYRADADGPWYFPTGRSSFAVRSDSGDPISGIASNKELLYVFKRDETFAVTGDMTEDRFRIERMAGDLGNIAHHTARSVGDSLWFLSKQGPARIIGAQQPQLIAKGLLPIFLDTPRDDSEKWQLHQAFAVNWGVAQKYLLFVPCHTTSGGNVHPNDSSRTFVADTSDQYLYDDKGEPLISWWPNDAINMVGGAVVHEDRLVWCCRDYGDTTAAMQYVHYRESAEFDEWNFADHAQPIEFYYETGWEVLGEPSTLKKARQGRVYSDDSDALAGADIAISSMLNFIEGATDTVASLSFGAEGSSAGFGVGSFGEDPFGDPTDSDLEFSFLPNWFRALQLRVESTSWGTKPVISGIEVEYTTPFEQKIKE